MIRSLWTIIFSCVFFLSICGAEYHSCGDWMSLHEKNELSDGIYNITSIKSRTDTSDNWREVYCDFDYTRNYAWTLFESGSRSSYSSTLKNTKFAENAPYNEDDVYTYRTSLYRLSRDWIYSLYFLSDYLYSTCNFDTSFSQDWLLFDLNDDLEYDPFFDDFAGVCVSAVSANIRGYLCQDTTVQVWSGSTNSYHLHVNSPSTSCGCTSWATGAVTSEDDFGFYVYYNTEFTCTASSLSTTNWWFGSYVNEYKIGTLSPSHIPSNEPTYKPTYEPSILPTISAEIIAQICLNNSYGNNNDNNNNNNNAYAVSTTEEKSGLTTTSTSGPTGTDTNNDKSNNNNNEESSSDSGNSNNNSDDGLSIELIVILSVIGGLVVICCIFCLFLTGVVSWHVRKKDELTAAQIHSYKNNNNNNNNNSNNDNNRNVYSTNNVSAIELGTNHIKNENNGKEGPNITWNELAAIHALTSRAMQFSNNNNNNNNGNKNVRLQESEIDFGENDNINNEKDNVNMNENDENDDMYENGTNQAIINIIHNNNSINNKKKSIHVNNDCLVEGGISAV